MLQNTHPKTESTSFSAAAFVFPARPVAEHKKTQNTNSVGSVGFVHKVAATQLIGTCNSKHWRVMDDTNTQKHALVEVEETFDQKGTCNFFCFSSSMSARIAAFSSLLRASWQTSNDATYHPLEVSQSFMVLQRVMCQRVSTPQRMNEIIPEAKP